MSEKKILTVFLVIASEIFLILHTLIKYVNNQLNLELPFSCSYHKDSVKWLTYEELWENNKKESFRWNGCQDLLIRKVKIIPNRNIDNRIYFC